MKRRIITCIILLISLHPAFSQNRIPNSNQTPSYPGGQEKFVKDFQKEFKYPTEAFKDNVNFPFGLFLNFEIDENGKMINPYLSPSYPKSVNKEISTDIQRHFSKLAVLDQESNIDQLDHAILLQVFTTIGPIQSGNHVVDRINASKFYELRNSLE